MSSTSGSELIGLISQPPPPPSPPSPPPSLASPLPPTSPPHRPPTAPTISAAAVSGIVAAAATLVLLAILLLALCVWMKRRSRAIVATVTSTNLSSYRAALDSRQLRRSCSYGGFGQSPLERALATGEVLRIKPSHPEAALRDCLCVGVGGTRGRPVCRILGLGDLNCEIELDKQHIRRARLRDAEEAHLEDMAARSAQRYLATLNTDPGVAVSRL